MNLKLNAMRRYLAREDLQVSTEAAAYLALMLDEKATDLAQKAIALLEEENASRTIQGLPPRVRLTADDVKRAGQ